MTRRFNKLAAIESINAFFQLPATGKEQDWEVELADASRTQEFIDAYCEKKWDEDQRFALMSLIVSSYDDVVSGDEHQPDIWSQISTLLLRESDLHMSILEYWACLDEDSPEDRFHISPYIHEVLSEIESVDK